MELDRIFKVSEFNEFISLYLGKVGDVVIEGEISELKVSQNRWVFGVIKDENASVDIFGTIFQLANIKELEVGMLVKVYGVPQLYQKTGRFSVTVTQIIPSGEGALRRAYEKLKAQLDSEGLFALERKRSLPRLPQTIGLVTAKGSQAYNDFIKVLRERMGGLQIKFVPVSVQGKDAPWSIVHALKYLNRHYPTLDLVVVTRGGGSLEDLIGFNNESVARAIFASRIPVVSAVGHEGDWSLADLVADVRASTPSNAAEIVVRAQTEVQREIQYMVDTLGWRLLERIREKIRSSEQVIHSLSDRYTQFITGIKDKIALLAEMFERYYLRYRELMVYADGYQRLLQSYGPDSVVKRGYSITFNSQGKIIRSVKDVAVGELIETRLHDGTITSNATNLNRRSVK